MFRKQPKIEVKPNQVDKKIIRWGWIVLLLNLILILVFYSNLPNKIPTHFNFKGEIDGYGSKSSLWVIFIMAALMYYGLNLIVKKVPPHKHNYPVRITEKNAPLVYAQSLRMLVILNFSIALMFFLISSKLILTVLNKLSFDIMLVVMLLVVFITALPFYFIYKMFKTPK